MLNIILSTFEILIISYLLCGLTSLLINIKYFIMILEDRKFRKIIWKIILLLETIVLWPLTINLSIKTIRNYYLKRILKRKELTKN